VACTFRFGTGEGSRLTGRVIRDTGTGEDGVNVQATIYGEDSSMEESRQIQKTQARYMSVKEFSEAVGISKWTIYRWIKKGRLKTYQRLPHEKMLISRDALYESVWPEEP